jgi:hypothetical protein
MTCLHFPIFPLSHHTLTTRECQVSRHLEEAWDAVSHIELVRPNRSGYQPILWYYSVKAAVIMTLAVCKEPTVHELNLGGSAEATPWVVQ